MAKRKRISAVGFDVAAMTGLLELDRNDLDKEAMEQPYLYWQVAEAAVSASAARDRAKQDLEDKRRQAELNHRKAAEIEGRKLTEKALMALVEEEPDVASARDTYLAAKEEADRLASLRTAFEQRASMLKVLAQLYASEYFTSPSVSTSVKEAREGAYKAARKAIGKTIRGGNGNG